MDTYYKVGLLFTAGALLGFLSISMSRTTSADESTSLVGMPALSPELLNALGNSPFKMPALLAINAVNSEPRARDIQMRAVRSAIEYMDDDSKEKLSFMGDKVVEVAKKMPGNMMPMGYFDPIGFSSKCSLGTLLFWREAEIKHGRVGMLASLGMLMGEQFGPILGGKDVPSIVALKDTPMGNIWWAILLVVSFPELAKPQSSYSYEKVGGERWWEASAATMPADLIPGDYGWDPLGLKPKDPKGLLDMQNRELNNGRLAMLAAAGIIAQEFVYGKKVF